VCVCVCVCERERERERERWRMLIPAKQCKNPPCRIFHDQILAVELAENSRFAKFQSLYKMLSITGDL
jgi:hypothetical protein